MVKKPEVEDDVERPAERLGAHAPEVEHFEIDVFDSGHPLQEICLLDELRPGIESDHVRAEERALQGPESGVAGDVENALPPQRSAMRLHEVRHEMPESLKGPVWIIRIQTRIRVRAAERQTAFELVRIMPV